MAKKKKKGKATVRSKDSQQRINVTKRLNLGHIPLFVQLAHKGLEKIIPEGVKGNGKEMIYVVAKDILSVSISNPAILEQVEKIEVVYEN